MNKQKKELLNYYKSELKQYIYMRKRVEFLEAKKSEILRKRDAVDGFDCSKIRIENAYNVVNPLTIYDEKVKQICEQIKALNYRIDSVNDLMNNLEQKYKLYIAQIYIYKRTTLESVALLNGLKTRQMRYLIDLAILDALNNF